MEMADDVFNTLETYLKTYLKKEEFILIEEIQEEVTAEEEDLIF
jgi:hypothetical protein